MSKGIKKPRCNYIDPRTKIRCSKRAGGLGVCYVHANVAQTKFIQHYVTTLCQDFHKIPWRKRLFLPKDPKELIAMFGEYASR